MNKYKLINKQTGESHLCDKVTIDGFDYYVSDEIPEEDDIATIPDYASLVVVGSIDNMPYSEPHRNWQGLFCDTCFDVEAISKFRKVIATNNPNIDIPKVVDEVEILFPTNRKGATWMPSRHEINNQYRQEGYNKSQETHPNSDEDMIEFDKWKNEKYKLLHGEYVDTNDYYSIPDLKSVKKYTTKELLKLWKEQKPKSVYYE